jgi:hypothetical protein
MTEHGHAKARTVSAAPFDYVSEEVAEAFTEWCAAEGVEARDDQEYRGLRQAFTAGMNEIARYSPADLFGPGADMPAQLVDALNRIRALEDRLRGALMSIRILDGLRPTCVLCHDQAADRQTTRGPACTDCVGTPPHLPDPEDPETWAFPDSPWDLSDPGTVAPEAGA